MQVIQKMKDYYIVMVIKIIIATCSRYTKQLHLNRHKSKWTNVLISYICEISHATWQLWNWIIVLYPVPFSCDINVWNQYSIDTYHNCHQGKWTIILSPESAPRHNEHSYAYNIRLFSNGHSQACKIVNSVVSIINTLSSGTAIGHYRSLVQIWVCCKYFSRQHLLNIDGI